MRSINRNGTFEGWKQSPEALSLGANGFFAKPLDVGDMVKRIEMLLDHKTWLLMGL